MYSRSQNGRGEGAIRLPDHYSGVAFDRTRPVEFVRTACPSRDCPSRPLPSPRGKETKKRTAAIMTVVMTSIPATTVTAATAAAIPMASAIIGPSRHWARACWAQSAGKSCYSLESSFCLHSGKEKTTPFCFFCFCCFVADRRRLLESDAGRIKATGSTRQNGEGRRPRRMR